MALRVDNIPWIVRPLYHSFSYCIALVLYGLCAALRFSCTIKYEGKERLNANQNYIYCTWHHTLAAYFTVFARHTENHIWMNHPSWVMKPIHYWLNFSGVKELALGSAGNSGREALQKVVLFLKNGYSTLITPDGPSGPAHALKPGVLQMSLETGVPIVPLKIIPSRFIVLPTWDKKRIPLPFSTIRVIYEKPVTVSQTNSDEIKSYLGLALKET